MMNNLQEYAATPLPEDAFSVLRNVLQSEGEGVGAVTQLTDREIRMK